MRLLILISLLLSQAVLAAPVLSITEITPGVYMHTGPRELADNKNHDVIANIGFIVSGRRVAVSVRNLSAITCLRQHWCPVANIISTRPSCN